jgi:hypothetical protein
MVGFDLCTAEVTGLALHNNDGSVLYCRTTRGFGAVKARPRNGFTAA